MLFRIESGAKAFTVTIEVPVEIRLKKRTLGKENFRGKQEQTLGIYYLPPRFSFVHSFSDYLLSVFNKPASTLGARDIVTKKIEKISVLMVVIN